MMRLIPCLIAAVCFRWDPSRPRFSLFRWDRSHLKKNKYWYGSSPCRNRPRIMACLELRWPRQSLKPKSLAPRLNCSGFPDVLASTNLSLFPDSDAPTSPDFPRSAPHVPPRFPEASAASRRPAGAGRGRGPACERDQEGQRGRWGPHGSRTPSPRAADPGGAPGQASGRGACGGPSREGWETRGGRMNGTRAWKGSPQLSSGLYEGCPFMSKGSSWFWDPWPSPLLFRPKVASLANRHVPLAEPESQTAAEITPPCMRLIRIFPSASRGAQPRKISWPLPVTTRVPGPAPGSNRAIRNLAIRIGRTPTELRGERSSGVARGSAEAIVPAALAHSRMRTRAHGYSHEAMHTPVGLQAIRHSVLWLSFLRC